MRKKLTIAILFAAAICLCIVSFTGKDAPQIETQGVYETTQSELKPTAAVSTAKDQTATKANSTTSKVTASTTKEKTTAHKNSVSTAATQKSTGKAVVKTTEKATHKATEKPTSKTTARITTTRMQTTTVKSTCYLTIECKSILSNMNSLKPGHADFVPDDGYILKNYTVKYENGDTVYDILKKGCQQSSIKLTTKNSVYGIYIIGINNLDEFDCGGQSGWIYNVNGISPPKSCGEYSVSAGDSIIFSYTC